MLVSDAMPSVGAVAKDFVLQGKTISVRDGICRDESGTLAGSDLDMASAVRNGAGLLGLSLGRVVCMASAAPAAFLGLGDGRGCLVAGQAADLVLLDGDFGVQKTWINGAPDAVSQ
jgi:N-acetylglucosamine-6-phosphate deacetylase